MSRLLTRDGKLVVREGIAQLIPFGVAACDCLCEAGGGCSICPEVPGGPYTSATYTHTLSGFPATWEYRTACGFDSYKIIYNGLNQFNGVHITTLNSETCEVNGLTLDRTVSMEKQEFTFDPSACTGTVLSTETFLTTWQLFYSFQWSLSNEFPSALSVFCNAPGLFRDGGFICLGASGSTFVSGGSGCPGFTFDWSTVVAFM